MVVAKSMRYRILGKDFRGKQLHAVSADIIGHTGTLDSDEQLGIAVSTPIPGVYKPQIEK